MTIPRIFINSHNNVLQLQQWQPATHTQPKLQLELETAISHRLKHVLRLAPGAELTLFCGDGMEYAAHIEAHSKKSTVLTIEQRTPAALTKPSWPLILAQSIARPEHMDLALQKATELGLTHIIPIISEHAQIKQKADVLYKRQQHWHKICIAASEQCGRCDIPVIADCTPIHQFIAQSSDAGFWSQLTANLHTTASQPTMQSATTEATPAAPTQTTAHAATHTTAHAAQHKHTQQSHPRALDSNTSAGAAQTAANNLPIRIMAALATSSQITPSLINYLNARRNTAYEQGCVLLVGPEGGFSQQEIDAAIAQQWQLCRLGPRTLRTETAAISGLTLIQNVLGDWR